MFLKENTITKQIINKSEFITYLYKCESEEQYKNIQTELKKKHYDATHVCSAMVSLSSVRSNDDGEPSGTAGVPILTVLQRNEMEDTAAFVVRYFGGIKLGAGGLIRAYSGCVADALNEATKQIKTEMFTYKLSIDYETDNKIFNSLNKLAYKIDKDYDLNVTYTIVSKNDIKEKIIEYTKNKYELFEELDKTPVLMDVVQ